MNFRPGWEYVNLFLPVFPLLYFKKIRSRKNEPHICIPAGFPGSGWAKLWGEKYPGLRGFGGQWAMGFPAVFRQSGSNPGVFPTGAKKRDISGFSCIGQDLGKRKGARTGLICSPMEIPPDSGSHPEGRIKVISLHIQKRV